MCFAPPAQVVEVGAGHAVVERGGARFEVLLHLIDEPVAEGDYLAVQAQRYAIAKMTAAEAREAADLYARIAAHLADPGGPAND